MLTEQVMFGNPETNPIFLTLFGIVLLLLNKPFAQGCYAWDKQMFKRDLGIKSFRGPTIAIGILVSVIGILLWLS
jgi:hypothetical protein